MKFLQAYPHLQINSQFYELPVDAIEKYFPNPWKKTDDEIKVLDGEMNGKLKYARDQVAPAITQIEFETSMSVVFQALSKCWELAY